MTHSRDRLPVGFRQILVDVPEQCPIFIVQSEDSTNHPRANTPAYYSRRNEKLRVTGYSRETFLFARPASDDSTYPAKHLPVTCVMSSLRFISQSRSVVVHSCIWMNSTIPKRYKKEQIRGI